MDIKKYEALLLSVELGSFSKAADKLGITQSGLTHMMNSLEKDIGFPVLTRNFNGVQLTPKGEKLLEDIKALTEASQHLKNKIDYINESSRKTITISTSSELFLRSIFFPFCGYPLVLSEACCRFLMLFRRRPLT